MGLDERLNSALEPVGTLEVALGHAARLLERDAALAAEQAGEILKAVPGHPRARLILGAAHRIGGVTPFALARPPPPPRAPPHSPAGALPPGGPRRAPRRGPPRNSALSPRGPSEAG